MKLKDEIRELEARRVAFTAMATDPTKTPEERAKWADLLGEVLSAQENLAADYAKAWSDSSSLEKFAYKTWLMMEDNEVILRPMRRFPQ
jgi:hypothetical protein